VIAGVADTHTALWYLLRHPRLSLPAQQFIDNAAHAGQSIALSTISLAEIVYLVEKDRLPDSAYQELLAALHGQDSVIEVTPLTVGIVEAMRQVPRSSVPDLPDRIVAATALYFGVPVISRDGRIRAANLDTIW
jgi:PIN domain nuclease of toxin-antitoxin system